MQRPRIKTRSLMIAVAVIAVVTAVFTRSDVPSLLKRAFWREGAPPRELIVGLSGGLVSYLHSPRNMVLDPRPAFWVFPVLTMALVSASHNRRVTWGAVGLSGLIFLSWAMLRRFLLVGPGRVETWPDLQIRYLCRRFVFWRQTGPLLPRVSSSLIHDIFTPYDYLTAHQTAGLFFLAVFMVALAARLLRPRPRSILALVALPANVYALVDWCGMMCAQGSWSHRHAPNVDRFSEFIGKHQPRI